MNSIHRINDFSLLKFVETQDILDFSKVQSEINLVNPQYVNVNLDQSDLNKTVWDSGSEVYKHTLNKIFSGAPLFSPTINTPKVNTLSTNVHLILKQGYSWINVFALHVIIKSSKTNEILISKIVQLSEFKIVPENLIINGSSWTEEVIFKIPTSSDILICQITEVLESDKTSLGTILNYPFDFEVLINEKPVPDYIQTKISLDSSHYLNINLISTETLKTIEQIILDYFEVSRAIIQVSHVINYGVGNVYKTIRISDEDNCFNSINIGLNLLSFYETNPNAIVNIIVSTEILCDNKLMKRTASVNTDLSTINPIIEAAISHPNQNYPVSVVQQNVVTNTIIEAKQTTKIVPIFQPIFIEFIKSDIIFENKNVHFNNVIKPTYLFLNKTISDEEQYIESKVTSDNKYYFDLSMFVSIKSPTTYQLIDVANLNMIGHGKVLLK